MASDSVEDLTRSIRVSRRRRALIARELKSHLDDVRRDLEHAGWAPEAASRESIARLGNLDDIVLGFESTYRPRRRTQVGLAVALAGGLLLGVYGIGGSFASGAQAHHQSPAVTHPAKKAPARP